PPVSPRPRTLEDLRAATAAGTRLRHNPKQRCYSTTWRSASGYSLICSLVSPHI
ncbi:hypothetical protein GGI16_006786, partial [Coemansia sp. S142-1]